MVRKSTKAAAAKKETVKPAETKAAPAVEVKEAPKAAEVKAAPKAAAPKKAAVKAEPVTAVTFEYADKKIVAKELLAAAMDAFKAAHKDVEVKEMNLYVNANDGYAYMVVNGTEYPEEKIEL
ncbi:MAG: DUF6465 family protein [Lachnospiraceae bacterium]|nr:DUF6465 family protein [Lachnospiraceae bacterium]